MLAADNVPLAALIVYQGSEHQQATWCGDQYSGQLQGKELVLVKLSGDGDGPMDFGCKELNPTPSCAQTPSWSARGLKWCGCGTLEAGGAL